MSSSTKGSKARKKRSTRRAGKKPYMSNLEFNVETFLGLEGLKRLAYMTEVVGWAQADIARIAEVDLSVVDAALKQGHVPSDVRNAKKAHDNLYWLYRLFTALLRLDHYSGTEVKRRLEDTEEFQQCIKKPPWYPLTLKECLVRGKISALRKAVRWLARY